MGLAAGLVVINTNSLPAHATVPPPDSITTYAGGLGSGTATLVGQQPGGVAVHGSVLYVADDNYDVVRAVDLNTGLETVVAGGALPPGCTEPCPATSAFIFPQGIATDAAGNLYITDFGQTLNGVVRKVDLSGTMTTFAGGGIGCVEPCAATSAKTVTPDDVTVDAAGNVYFADFGDNRVRKVDLSGNITTIAGTGTGGNTGDGGPAINATLSGPSGVAIDSSGNVYISDFFNNEVRKVDHTTGFISRFAGGGIALGDGGPATSAFVYHPMGLRVDAAGNVYMADRDEGRVRKVDTTGVITTYAGGGSGPSCIEPCPATSIYLPSPVAVALDGLGNLFIADFYSLRVHRVDHSTQISTTAAGMGGQCGPAGDGGQALAAQVCQPSGMTFDTAGNLYFADVPNGRIRKITPAGVVSTVAGGGSGCTEPCPATSASLNHPNSVAVDGTGQLFIADTNNNKIRKVDGSGNITTIAGTGGVNFNGDNQLATLASLYLPSGVAVNGLGDVFIADQANERVRKVDHVTQFITTVAGTGSPGFSGDNGPGTSAQLTNPISVAFDGSGSMYISDNGNARVRKLTSGIITTYAGGGGPSCPALPGNGDGLPAICASLPYPQQIYVDAAGRLFIADGPIRVVSSDGYISTLAGCNWAVDPNCPFHFVEGGPATSANVGGPAVAVDSNHNAFIGGGTFIFRVQAPLAPASPTAVTATAGDSQVSVSWTGGAANGNPVYRYTVTPYKGLTPLTPVQVTGLPLPTSTTFRLANGPTYTFKVSASNAFGTSPDSVASNPVVPLLAPAGGINTHAGTVGSGNALSLGQVPFSLALAPGGSHLYAGDWANGVVRDITVGNGQEGALAGEVAFGYSGDGGLATSAMIEGAGAMVNCGPGLTYIADTYNYVIRKVDAGGTITTVAGTGRPGYSGDGGPAVSASLSRVFGLACRTGGGLYISDSDNGAVRILDAAGNISTWWYGFSFPTGLVEVGGLNNVDVSDSGSFSAVVNLTDTIATLVAGTFGSPGYGGDNGPATAAKLNQPRGLAWDSGWLYIADTGNNRVRAVDYSGTITTVAGNGIAGFSGDGADATAARLNQPTDVVVDTSTFICNHALYIADSGNFRVRLTSGQQCSGGHAISTIAGNGTPSLSGDGGQALQAQLGNPYAVAVDASGNQYIADNQNNVVREISPTGVISTIAGNGVPGYSGDGASATAAQLKDPRGVAVASNGDIYISDAGNQRVRKVSGGIITTVAGNGTAGFTGDNGPAVSAEINLPRAVALDVSGNLYIADTGNNRVRRVDHATGTITTLAGTGVAGYSGDGAAATAAKLNGPRGLAVDALSNVYIGDSGNNRVRRVDHATGTITTYAGNGTAGLAGDGRAAASAELNDPFGLAFDGVGNLYIADELNQRIRVVDTLGTIQSVVGTCGGLAGFSGDGGPAASAQVNFPFGVAVDSFGELFIADVDNNRVRGATGLVASRAAPCPGPTRTPGSRTTKPSGSPPTPPQRIPETGGSAGSFASYAALPGRVSNVPSMPTRVAPQQPPAAQPAPVTKPGAAQPNPPAAQKPPAAAPVAGRGRAPAPMAVSSAPQNSMPRPESLWWLLVVPVALLTVSIALARLRKRRARP